MIDKLILKLSGSILRTIDDRESEKNNNEDWQTPKTFESQSSLASMYYQCMALVARRTRTCQTTKREEADQEPEDQLRCRTMLNKDMGKPTNEILRTHSNTSNQYRIS